MPRLACRGLEELCWQSEGIEPFIKEALELVRDLDAVLATLKDNVRRAQVGSAAGAWVAQHVLRLRRIDAPQRSLAYPAWVLRQQCRHPSTIARHWPAASRRC